MSLSFKYDIQIIGKQFKSFKFTDAESMTCTEPKVKNMHMLFD